MYLYFIMCKYNEVERKKYVNRILCNHILHQKPYLSVNLE